MRYCNMLVLFEGLYFYFIFIQNLVEEARANLIHLTKDPAGYKNLLEGLITQVCSQVTEMIRPLFFD